MGNGLCRVREEPIKMRMDKGDGDDEVDEVKTLRLKSREEEAPIQGEKSSHGRERSVSQS